MRRILLTSFTLILGAASVFAHHSLTADYDRNKPVHLKGKLAAIDWMNPHAFFYIDVTGPDGQVTRWKLEGATPNMIVRFPEGKTRAQAFSKIGDEVTFEGIIARDGSSNAMVEFINFSDGTRLQTSP